MKRFFILFLALIFSTGCTSPAETITTHFKQMSELASIHRANCENMGASLCEYLKTNEKSLRSAIMDVSNASPDEAMQIFNSSVLLHQETQHCSNESTIEFRKQLSEVVLKHALNK